MSKIRILPEQLANQIAAGEVVERPASVVKELLENSIDAGADRIEVEIAGGGTRSIRVIDNGEGMDEDDVLLCFERHGTSKLFEPKQLAGVTTLGFRGEAIPSIAAVSKMTITSRPHGSDLGTTVSSHFGTIKTVRESGAKTGTTVEINDLFGNTPARRKFLRTARTEIAHIDDTVKSCALARPDISFVLRIDGRETLRLDHDLAPAQRLAMMLNYRGEFITVDSTRPGPDGMSVHGLLIPPEDSAPVAGRLRLLVNGRVIRDRLLVHAVGEGLRSFLLKGRFPAGVLSVELPPTAVDVNVHPAKQEVRFKDGRTVHQLVRDTVQDAMVRQQQRVRRDIFEDVELSGQIEKEPVFSRDPAAGGNNTAREPIQPGPPRAAQPPMMHHLFETRDHEPPMSPHAPTTGAAPAACRPDPIRVEDLVVIGCYRNLYLFCRNRDKLVVIDQHAAHERLLYEQLRKQYASGRLASQQLLFPITVELTAQQAEHLQANLDTLTNMGFGLRDFGDTTWVIAAVPALAGSVQPQHLLLDVLESFGSDRDHSGHRTLDTILATMACKAAVKAGDHLDDREIADLLRRMAGADLFSHCPHGRPVVKIFNESDLKKWFSRT